jgi:hypothetical protein
MSFPVITLPTGVYLVTNRNTYLWIYRDVLYLRTGIGKDIERHTVGKALKRRGSGLTVTTGGGDGTHGLFLEESGDMFLEFVLR